MNHVKRLARLVNRAYWKNKNDCAMIKAFFHSQLIAVNWNHISHLNSEGRNLGSYDNWIPVDRMLRQLIDECIRYDKKLNAEFVLNAHEDDWTFRLKYKKNMSLGLDNWGFDFDQPEDQ